TWCSHMDLLDGASLTFKTLRDGFPNSRLQVVDGASIAEARDEMRRHSRALDADYVQLEHAIELSQLMEQVLIDQKDGAAVFVDPDLCFWRAVDDWSFDGVAAGRLIPLHHCEFHDCITAPRLHSSLF